MEYKAKDAGGPVALIDKLKNDLEKDMQVPAGGKRQVASRLCEVEFPKALCMMR